MLYPKITANCNATINSTVVTDTQLTFGQAGAVFNFCENCAMFDFT